jgi:zinc transporter
MSGIDTSALGDPASAEGDAEPVSARRIAHAESGLICAYGFPVAGRARQVRAGEIPVALARPDEVLWLHFNASDAAARRWLAQLGVFPPHAMRAIADRDARCRMEADQDGVLVVLNDLTFEDDTDPDEVATLWAYATQERLVTARAHPLKSVDRLRTAVRDGAVEHSGFALLGRLLELQLEALDRLIDSAAVELDHFEDRILVGRIGEQRARLGRVRRLLAHLQRHFSPQRLAMSRGLQRLAPRLAPADADRLRAAGETLATLTDAAAALHERAKLLQEELGSRIAEETNRNLYVLTIFSAVVMPMNLVAGIFGMNVAGLPGTERPEAFLWTIALIFVSGLATMLALRASRLL